MEHWNHTMCIHSYLVFCIILNLKSKKKMIPGFRSYQQKITQKFTYHFPSHSTWGTQLFTLYCTPFPHAIVSFGLKFLPMNIFAVCHCYLLDLFWVTFQMYFLKFQITEICIFLSLPWTCCITAAPFFFIPTHISCYLFYLSRVRKLFPLLSLSET